MGLCTIQGVPKPITLFLQETPKACAWLERLPIAGTWIRRASRMEWTAEPQYRGRPECEVCLPIGWLLLYIAPNRKFVVRRVRFDLCHGQRRMVVIEWLPRDEVSYDPRTAAPIVVEVHQMIVGYNVWTAYDDAIIAAPSMIVATRVHRHMSDSVADLRENLQKS